MSSSTGYEDFHGLILETGGSIIRLLHHERETHHENSTISFLGREKYL